MELKFENGSKIQFIDSGTNKRSIRSEVIIVGKGKKFNAAEKHFEEKCIEWRKKIRELESANRNLHQKLCESCNEIEKLQMENEHLKQQNKALMKLKDMNPDDVKTLIRSKESVNKFMDLCSMFNRAF